MFDPLLPCALAGGFSLGYWAIGRHTTAPVTATLAAGLWTVYAGVALPGFAGLLTLPGIVAGLLLSALLMAVVGLLLGRHPVPPQPADRPFFDPRGGGRWAERGLFGLAVAVVLLPQSVWTRVPFFDRAVPLPQMFRDFLGYAEDFTAVPLNNMDVLVYHLPTFVRFLQQGSFAIGANPFDSYSYGWEAMFGLPLASGHGLHGMVVGTAVAALLAVVSAYTVAAALSAAATPDAAPVHGRASLAAAGCFVFLSLTLSATIGKNDVATAAFLLAALACLLAPLSEGPRMAPARWCAHLLASAMAMSLALAVKPSALGLMPCWLGTLAVLLRPGGRPLVPSPLRMLTGLGVAFVFLLGSGFMLRTLAVLGALSDPDFRFAFDLTLVKALATRGEWYLLDGLRDRGILVLFVLGTIGAAALAITAGRRGRLVAAVVTVWAAAAGVLFTITPWSVYFDQVIQWRLGFAAILLSLTVVVVAGLSLPPLGWLFGRRGAAVPQPGPLRSDRSQMGRLLAGRLAAAGAPLRVSLAVVPILVLALAGAGGRHELIGVPWAEAFNGHPDTLYRRIQQDRRPHRIYAMGLLPYGLMGPTLENRVFYDVETRKLRGPETRGRIRAVIEDFKPDLVMTAAGFEDADRQPPHLSWLRGLSCLTEVPVDPAFAVFAVTGDCAAALADTPRPSGPLRMRTY
ncbi:hypothetical protein [Azospirillum thermophilum]|uniref:Uncharacterized protein n=1 Tax=Azospirillum thermophilum TaxID=2202148 RepID=A0A2S2CL31_9PROT|nr:hypothetical protein [Azospirillum thermophilum]AWK85182.1 hypothetical protein DEW08_02390 [Azospirillum thermophilum]